VDDLNEKYMTMSNGGSGLEEHTPEKLNTKITERLFRYQHSNDDPWIRGRQGGTIKI
jgi:hypothetical protein